MKRLYEVQKTKSVRKFVVFLLIVGGTIAGRVSTNHIELSILPGRGLILKTYQEMRYFKKKIDLS